MGYAISAGIGPVNKLRDKKVVKGVVRGGSWGVTYVTTKEAVSKKKVGRIEPITTEWVLG